MAYQKFVENIASEIDTAFAKIAAEYNFDLGPEYEIALCRLFRLILPIKYGICRGFVVGSDGDMAGDDIIIFDQERFPTLRMLEKDRYDRKEQIPAEAVYAYIEAKHTIHIGETKQEGQSLAKALSQVSAVKRIKREKMPLEQIDHHISFVGNMKAERQGQWPDHMNPFYGAIFGRNLKINGEAKKTTLEELIAGMKTMNGDPATIISPDLIVLGSNAAVIPVLATSTASKQQFESPFYIDGISALAVTEVKCSPIAFGVIMLLYALDSIKLYRMPYRDILRSQL